MPKKGGQNKGGSDQKTQKEKKQKEPKEHTEHNQEKPPTDNKPKQKKKTDDQQATGGSGKKGKRQQPTVEDHTHGYKEGAAHPYIPHSIRQPYVEPNHVKEFVKVATPLLKRLL